MISMEYRGKRDTAIPVFSEHPWPGNRSAAGFRIGFTWNHENAGEGQSAIEETIGRNVNRWPRGPRGCNKSRTGFLAISSGSVRAAQRKTRENFIREQHRETPRGRASSLDEETLSSRWVLANRKSSVQ